MTLMNMPDPSLFTPVINGYLPEPHASLMNGILFGIPLKTTKELNTSLIEVGLIHIVVLSGSNINLISTITNTFTRSFSKNARLLISMLSICLFVAFVSPQAPIVRAAFMSLLTSVSIIYGRKTLSLLVLFTSGLLSILLFPQWLTTISFQLSYAATLGLILFSQKIVPSTFKRGFWDEMLEGIKSNLRISFAAQVFTVPIIFVYFRQISFIAPLSNLLVAWTIPPLMVFGFITAILGKAHVALGLIPSYICYSLLSYFLFVVNLVKKVPFGFYSF